MALLLAIYTHEMLNIGKCDDVILEEESVMRYFSVLILAVLSVVLLSACTDESKSKVVVTDNQQNVSQVMPETQQDNVSSFKEITVDQLGPFQRGLSFSEETYDEKYNDIMQTFHSNLKAWASNDKSGFKDTFISEDVADYHMFFFEESLEYEFVGTPYIDDQSSESKRINVLFQYRTSNEPDNIKSATTSFKQDKNGVWKIGMID